MMLLRHDENEVMVNFKPGDESEYDVFLLVTQAYSDKVKLKCLSHEPSLMASLPRVSCSSGVEHPKY